MATADRTRMSSIDTAWLRMDRPYNLMTINGVMVLEDRLTLSRLKEVLEHRFLTRHKRLKQRPVHTSGGYFWETDTHFEIDSHVRRIGLPGAGGKEELQEFVSNLVSTPMDPTKPLWDFTLVQDYQGGSAVIARQQHCYADGMAMIHLVMSMTDMAPGVPTDTTRTTAPSKAYHSEEEGLGDIFRHLFHPVSEAVTQAIKTGKGLLDESVDLVRHPGETLGYARQGAGLARETARLLTMPDDPPTRYRGKPGVSKRVAWADPLPLDEVKTIGKALGCSVNDVLLASVAGALHAYLVRQGDPVDRSLEIRAAVPVNLRPWEQAKNLGNFFGLVLLTLPIGIENPVERLYEVRRRMEELKASYQAMLTLGLLEVLGLGPKLVQASVFRTMAKKATAVMTNVPGPAQPLYLGGAKISEMMFWVPQTGSIGMGVSILSYNGHVHFGLITDAKMVRDPEAIIGRFGHEFEKLLLATLMQTWGQPPEPRAVEAAIRTLKR